MQYIYIINILPFIIQLYLFDYGCSYIYEKFTKIYLIHIQYMKRHKISKIKYYISHFIIYFCNCIHKNLYRKFYSTYLNSLVKRNSEISITMEIDTIIVTRISVVQFRKKIQMIIKMSRKADACKAEDGNLEKVERYRCQEQMQ